MTTYLLAKVASSSAELGLATSLSSFLAELEAAEIAVAEKPTAAEGLAQHHSPGLEARSALVAM